MIATSNGAYSDETWLQAQKQTNASAGWLGRDPTAIDLVQGRPSWKKVNEIYKKYSRGQAMGELAMREITGLLWMADVIDRAKSVEPAALQKAANETKMGPEQLIIDYKGVQFENGQNVLATGVVTQIGWDGEKHTLWPGTWPARPISSRSTRTRAGRSATASRSRQLSDPDAMTELAQAVVNGLQMGFLYALVAVGLTIIWGLMEMINFAHGEFLMLGMFGAWWLSADVGLDPLLGIVPIALAMYAFGVLVYRHLMRACRGAIRSPRSSRRSVCSSCCRTRWWRASPAISVS